MFCKTIKYTDYDGNVREEDFYFNLNKAEVIDMQLGELGGLEKMLQKIITTQDNVKLVKVFKDIILRSYGEKSLDGKRFIKNQQLRDEFEQTEAFSELYVELATDAEKAADFINKVLPAEYTSASNDKANNIVPVNN